MPFVTWFFCVKFVSVFLLLLSNFKTFRILLLVTMLCRKTVIGERSLCLCNAVGGHLVTGK